MLNKRNITWIVPLVLFVTFPLWRIPVSAFLAPRGGYDPENEIHDNVTHDFAMERITITQNQKGRKTALIRSDYAQTGENKNEYFLENVNADIFDKDGNITNVVARLGTYNTLTKNLILEEDVVVTRLEDDQKMYTDYLVYSDEKRTVLSPGKAKFVGEGFKVNGGTMKYYVDDMAYTLKKRVKCVLYTSNSL